MRYGSIISPAPFGAGGPGFGSFPLPPPASLGLGGALRAGVSTDPVESV